MAPGQEIDIPSRALDELFEQQVPRSVTYKRLQSSCSRWRTWYFEEKDLRQHAQRCNRRFTVLLDFKESVNRELVRQKEALAKEVRAQKRKVTILRRAVYGFAIWAGLASSVAFWAVKFR